MTHSRMVATRRKKQKGRKDAERVAKEASRLRKQASDAAVRAAVERP